MTADANVSQHKHVRKMESMLSEIRTVVAKNEPIQEYAVQEMHVVGPKITHLSILLEPADVSEVMNVFSPTAPMTIVAEKYQHHLVKKTG